MPNEPLSYRFPRRQWEAAKKEAQAVMIERARQEDTISYSELVSKIESISLEAHDPRLSQLLVEVATEENAAGRGMLTVVVVHNQGDKRPGAGFFELARQLGRDVKNRDDFWIAELKKVHASWPKLRKR